MESLIFRGKYFIDNHIYDLIDEINDKKICGTSLVEYVPSVKRNDETGVGFTGSQSTRYRILDMIFEHIKLDENDNFIDIGCGKGRVLAYLIKNGAKCRLNGVEINEEVGRLASVWAERYDNVNIIVADAFSLNYDEYNVFFLGRPFLPVTFKEFIEKFENEITHPIKFIYWVDQQSGKLLTDRPGWTMETRDSVWKYKGMYLARCPQRYSVWNYNPNEK